MDNVSSHRTNVGDAQVLAELARSGFSIRESGRAVNIGNEGFSDAQWALSPTDTGRGVYFRINGGPEWVYTIDVYEFRGGEGYENEELKSTDLSEVLAAILHWADWAKEPFVRPRGWWQRLRSYLGQSYGTADASGSPRRRT